MSFENLDAELADWWCVDYSRRSFGRVDRYYIWKKDKGRCAYCRRKLKRKDAVFDHILPWSKGGATVVENGAVCCRSCNVIKGKNGDKHSPFDVAGLFFRKVHKIAVGPRRWGGYDRPSMEVKKLLRGTRNGS